MSRQGIRWEYVKYKRTITKQVLSMATLKQAQMNKYILKILVNKMIFIIELNTNYINVN